MRPTLLTHIAALSLLIAAAPALAAWPNDPHLGSVIVCSSANTQDAVTTIPDGAGGLIAVWQDLRTGSRDIYAQRIGSAGQALWAANGVAVCISANSQFSPRIVSDGAGGAIIAWFDERVIGNREIYAQRINSAGAVQWAANGVVVCNAAAEQSYVRLCAVPGGGAIIAWQDNRSGNFDIYAQRINASGVSQWAANGVAVCVSALAQQAVNLVADGSGGALIAWEDFRSSSSFDIYAQRLSSTGAAQWPANGIPICMLSGDQSAPQLVEDGAGGALIAWGDERDAAQSDVYVQRLIPNGFAQFTANGVAVSPIAGDQYSPAIATDGVGGAIVAWSDFRNLSDTDVYAQRVAAGGALMWTAGGMAICTQAGNQNSVAACSDGAGGALIVWSDRRVSPADDIHAQRISALGLAQWTLNGPAVCSATNSQYSPQVVTDGDGGALIVWTDYRTMTGDIHAQRVERFGMLGSPEPVITSVTDVPNDQGGRIKVVWAASYLDVDPTFGIFDYRVWRAVPQSALVSGELLLRRGATTSADEAAATGRLLLPFAASDYAWEFVANAPAAISALYSLVVDSEGDSIAGSNPHTAFRIEARATSSQFADRWFSLADSGYSVDDLAPAAPAPLTGFYAGGATRLAWNPNREADLVGYRLYRGDSPTFVPSPANLIAALPDTGFIDAAGAPHIYKLTAVDVHGNESPVATLTPQGVLETGDAPAGLALALSGASPNPLRGIGLVRYSLARSGRVAMTVLDVNGREVAALVRGEQPAGVHAATWDGRDSRGGRLAAGIYFVRLAAEGQVLTRSMVLAR